MPDLTQRVAIITGAAGSLGKAVAQQFLAAGARLALIDRGKGRLANLFPQMENSADHLLIDSVDVGDPDLMNWVVSQVNNHFGRIDILVNTVGGFKGGTSLDSTPLETWDSLMNTNARTAFIACQAVIPLLLEQAGGKIINVAARAGLSGSANQAAYSASKSAVIRVTESMSAELKKEGINVNCVLPGTMDTPQNRLDMPRADFGRWVSPDSVAEVILFLASDAARDIHGAAIPVYGQN